MDLMFRGRGADVGVRAPLWLVRVAGAVLGVAAMTLGDLLGASYLSGIGPLYLRLAGAVVGALLAPTVLGAFLWVLAGTLASIVLLVSMTTIAFPAARHFVRTDPDTGAVDAVVVFSGGVTNDGRLTGQVLERLLTGMRDVQQRRIPVLALSVVTPGSDRGRGRVTSEADQRAIVALLGGGVDVRFVFDVASTRDEALAFSALARTHHWTRVLAVTSPLHTRRACGALEVAGLAAECRPAESRSYSLTNHNGSMNRLLVFQDVFYESVATTLYRIRGWN